MPNKFTHRSCEKELLDKPDLKPDLLFKNLRELDILNRTTGGHAISLKGIKQLITDPTKTYNVVDLGCGSGDVLMAIADWARLKHFKVTLTGVDRNANAIEYLKNHCSGYPEINGIIADYQDFLNGNERIDVVHCSLFCHHLTDDELTHLFIYFRQHVTSGFIINDLHRHWLAFYSAWLLPRLLNGTVMAKNDGPLSVLRGFKSGELTWLLHKANITNYSIQKEGVFRYLIISNKS
jgi:SAM-dependent methyltransferase